ncbi:MAG: hypothetical protein JEZ05_06605 [Tenericutes bacterium]|nr:hypothetical protein [Mycoplasmatota bacterium]
MDNNIEFQIKKKILDELYKANKISGMEWYTALSKLIEEFDLEKEINSQ